MLCSGSRPCCFITEASRGFGRSAALARQFSDSGTDGDFILVSRSGDGLEETRKISRTSVLVLKVKLMI